MAPALSKLIQNPRYLYSGAAFGAILYLLTRSSDNSSPAAESFVRQSNKDDKGKEKAHLDAKFFKRLQGILKIMIPGWKSSETFWLIVVAAMLITRTRFDVWMISNGTSIESAIIDRNMARFIKYLSKFIFSMPAIALTNQILKYGLNNLKLKFRKRFTLYIYNKYLQGYTYYKMSNLDNRISNADQLLTQDVEKFCNSIVDLYSNLSKPLLDIVIYIYKLTGTVGAQGPATMIGYLVFSGLILTRMRRPTGKLTINEQKLEGEFRYVNSRLITNSEEIAFYHGNKKERHTLLMAFENLYQHLRKFIFFRFKMGLVDDIIAKYTATTFGYLIVSRPFLDLANPNLDNKDHSELLEEYYKTGRMLVRLSQAIGRIVLAGREMTRLAGFTARITELIKVTDELNSGTYSRTMVTRPSLTNLASEEQKQLVPGSGKIIIEDYIIHFDKVPLVTPNGDVLIEELTFEVKSGANVLVCGPNGCGKSSLFRVLGELWPIFGGVLTKPERGNLFYVPQRPYMTLGTLRDQVIYPDTVADMEKKKITDEKLEEFLTEVQLGVLLDREGGWDAVQDWMDVLSGGEKQRMAMARLFYHQPQFAILDECTSAVSVDVESFIYQRCREVGITLFTVSHRKSLWKHHEFYLHMDGRGKYDFGPIDEHTEEFGS